jgi:hypothetical protein
VPGAVNAAAALGTISEADLAPLDVEADLTIAIEGEEIRITSKTNRPLVDIPSMRVALVLARQGGSSGLRIVPKLANVLAAADITAGIAVDGTGVAVLGADADPGPLARRVSPHVEVRENGAARALLDAVRGR